MTMETTYTAANDQLKALMDRAGADPRLLELMRAVLRDPFAGIGKHGPLKDLGAGVWSRRITQEHRCVVLVRAMRWATSSRADRRKDWGS